MGETTKPTEAQQRLAAEITVAAAHGLLSNRKNTVDDAVKDVARFYHMVLQGICNTETKRR